MFFSFAIQSLSMFLVHVYSISTHLKHPTSSDMAWHGTRAQIKARWTGNSTFPSHPEERVEEQVDSPD